MEVNVIEIDNKNYYILETLEIDNNKYFILANENDKKDFCVRKVIKENNQEFLVKLENAEELDKVLLHFCDKYIKEGD